MLRCSAEQSRAISALTTKPVEVDNFQKYMEQRRKYPILLKVEFVVSTLPFVLDAFHRTSFSAFQNRLDFLWTHSPVMRKVFFLFFYIGINMLLWSAALLCPWTFWIWRWSFFLLAHFLTILNHASLLSCAMNYRFKLEVWKWAVLNINKFWNIFCELLVTFDWWDFHMKQSS